MPSIDSKIDRAFHSLESAKNTDYIGEEVSQLEHSLQCAYFAEQSGHSREVVIASLFHDIGHFASETQQYNMANLGVVNHEWIGAKLAYDFGFSAKVALLIGYHVEAKRYLAGKKKDYFERLSAASKGTLAFQGGPMNDEQRQLFESHPLYKEILQVRVNDEKAKEIGLQVPNLNYYRKVLKEHIHQSIHPKHEVALVHFIDSPWVENLKRFLENSY